MTVRIALALCALALGMGGAASAQPMAPAGNADAASPLFGFAESLFQAGEYYRAVGEFQRFLFFHAEHPLAAQAQLRIALAYFCGERWVQAFEVFRQVTRLAPDPAVREVAALWMAETLAKRGAHAEAVELYRQVMTRYAGTPTAERAAYLLAWSLLWQRRWREAQQAFAAMPPASVYHGSARRLAATLGPPPALPRRSPTVARLLSTVVPGAGHIYTGETLDGLIGLGVHAALIAGTSAAILAGLEGAGGIGAFFTWGFYRAQMGNAAANARQFNAQAEERFIGQLAAQERRWLTAYPLPIPCAG
jgi:hypothetical protein